MKINCKKLLCAVMALLMVASLAACGNESAKETEAPALEAYKSAVKESATKTCGEEVVTIQYVYNAEGQCIKEICTDTAGNEVKNYYTFGDDGNVNSEIHNNPDGSKDKFRHTYIDGLMTKTVHTEPSGSKNTYTYTHNEDGTVAGYSLVMSSGDTIEVTYTYNALGAVEKMESSASVTVYTYNEFGDVVTETVTENGTETVTTYEYTYQQ